MKEENIRLEVYSYTPYLIASFVYFIIRKNVTGALLTPFDTVEIWKNIYYVPYLILLNLKLIFVPHGLHFFYLSYPSSIFQWQVVFSIALFFAAIAYLFIKITDKVLFFSVISFLVFLFPVLNIIPSASTSVSIIAMRWLYLPLSFLCLGFTAIIRQLMFRNRAIIVSAIIVILLYLGFYTYTMNRNYWHDEKTLFYQEVMLFKNDYFAGELADKLFGRGGIGGSL